MDKAIVCALMIGRKGSVGFPGKNTYPVLGRPMAAYPLMAAKASRYVDRVYVSTDAPELMDLAREQGAELVERPPELATREALGSDVFAHGYFEIKQRIAAEGLRIEFLVLLHANSPTLTAGMIDQGVDILRNNETFDSAVTTSVYNMWSPLRARKLGPDGCLYPMVPFEAFGDPRTLNCDRDSQGDVHFADMAISVVRPRCLENMDGGLLPQKWMGQRIAPIASSAGCDVDYEWQVPMVEYWLISRGYSETETPYDWTA